MDAGERREPHVAGGLRLLDRGARASRRPRRSRPPGTAPGRGSTPGRPRSAGSRAAPTSPPPGRCGATASSKRCSTRASSPSIASRRTCSHGSSTTVEPVLHLVARLARARRRSPAEIAAREANSAFAAWSHGRSRPVVERAAARGQRERVLPLAVVGDDVGEVVGAARLQVGVGDRVGQLRRGGDVPPRRLEVAGRRLDPAPRAAARRRGRAAGAASPAASSAARRRCAPRLSPRTIHAQPNPLAIASARSGSCAALQASAASMFARSVAGEGEVLGLAGAAHARGRRRPPRRRTSAACASSARSVSPASAIASSANARMLSSSRYAGRRRRRRR